MHEIQFIQDLAIMMTLAGLVTVLFQKFKQPIVLGYILVGVLVGPYTPPFKLISDENSIAVFSELGMIFLMFALGLEFSLRNLMKVGVAAFVAAVLEIVVMIFIGYEIGKFFGWGEINSLFLGAMLAISSTTIIVKALNDLGLTKHRFAQLIFGVLVVEDILAIAILALLSSIGTSHAISTGDVVLTLGKLLLFLTVSLSVGILTIPRLLTYVAKFKNQEILLIAVLGLCFGFCLLVIKLHYSIVLGAFTIGAIIAECRHVRAIERLVEPLRDMFSAVFFVAIGLMFDPRIVLEYAFPIVIITMAVVLGKVITCSFGTFITGQGARTGFRVGMGLAQIGEFSFIIAALGLSLNLTASFLFPIAVAVSVLTTLLTPYLIKYADPVMDGVKKIIPQRIAAVFYFYTRWCHRRKLHKQTSEITKAVQKSLINIFLNVALVIAVFIGLPYLEESLAPLLFGETVSEDVIKTIFWGGALVLLLPFLIAIYRKLQALSMILAGFMVRRNTMGRLTDGMRKIIYELVPIFFMLMLMMFVFILSANILPSLEWVISTLAVILILALILWKWFVKLHSRLQISLMETMQEDKDKHH